MYSFYAYLHRMKYINRWGLMRNTETENIKEHTLDVAFIAHALAILSVQRLGKQVDPEKTVLLALFHDVTEVITGDLATPIKYFDPEIRDSYKRIEAVAADKLLEMLPEDMRGAYAPLLNAEEGEEARLVKAADKLSAHIKCLTELKAGNSEYAAAAKATGRAIAKMNCPEAQIFIDEFIQSYTLSLDELNKERPDE